MGSYTGFQFLNPLLGGGYADKVMGYKPIAYWPLWEASGAVAHCMVLVAQNGVYTGVTLGEPGIGDGNTSPFFDGATDYVNIYTATLGARFNTAEGTLMAWGRVANVGVWNDATDRAVCYIGTDPNNRVALTKTSVLNQVGFYYAAGGVSEIVLLVTTGLLTFFQVAITWSKTADEFKAYYQGTQTGATQTVLGNWVGALSPNRCNVGCRNNAVPDFLWHGWLAHVAVWDRVLPAADIMALSVVS